jgi:hypothetical protein
MSNENLKVKKNMTIGQLDREFQKVNCSNACSYFYPEHCIKF